MPVESGDEVRLEYVGRLRDGTIFDASSEEIVAAADAGPDRASPPLSLEVGAERIVRGPGQIVEEIESAVRGLEEGDVATVTVPPEKAYGEASDEQIRTFDRDRLTGMMGDAVSADESTPTVGMSIRTPGGDVGEIVAVDDESIQVDFNHELAGETLEFRLEVAEIA